MLLEQTMQPVYILFGASSAIAKAYISHISDNIKEAHVICISHSKIDIPKTHLNIEVLNSDYTKTNLRKITQYLKEHKITPTQVVIFNGLLHFEQYMPEKKLEDIDENYFSTLINTNSLIPILCVQAVFPLLNNKTPCVIAALSARVGSIKDNKLGGWYSYRASKAALNMLFKTMALELARRAKKTNLVLFHPGTTNTNLSKPFQKNVPPEKLFSTDFVASQLFSLLKNADRLAETGLPTYIDWQGNPIKW
jgi:NAD(P)-dependent dehydrogenase (short-subunit alcohol dehydrogenase family)